MVGIVHAIHIVRIDVHYGSTTGENETTGASRVIRGPNARGVKIENRARVADDDVIIQAEDHILEVHNTAGNEKVISDGHIGGADSPSAGGDVEIRCGSARRLGDPASDEALARTREGESVVHRLIDGPGVGDGGSRRAIGIQGGAAVGRDRAVGALGGAADEGQGAGAEGEGIALAEIAGRATRIRDGGELQSAFSQREVTREGICRRGAEGLIRGAPASEVVIDGQGACAANLADHAGDDEDRTRSATHGNAGITIE